MLTVPYEVKKALKQGRMRKEYKFKTYSHEISQNIIDIATFSIQDPSASYTTQWEMPVIYHTYPVETPFDFQISITVMGSPVIVNLHFDEEEHLVPLNGGYPLPAGTTVLDLTSTVVLVSGNIGITSPSYIIETEELTYQFTIDNDNLISESVKIDERMCSGDEIKFGLCEGSSLEFQYFGFDNIRGCEIEAILSVEYDDDGESAYYDIPMGWFTVDQCPKQFSTGIYKVTAYNKLKSEYLDQKANNLIIKATQDGIVGRTDRATLSTITDKLMVDYKVERAYTNLPITTQYSVYANAQYSINNEGKALGYLCSSLDFYVDDYSLDNIYRLWMNCKKIYDKLVSFIPTEVYNKTVSEIYYDSGTWRTRNSGYLREKISGEDSYPMDLSAHILIEDHGSIKMPVNKDNRENESVFTPWMTNVRSVWTSGTSVVTFYNFPVFWKTIEWSSAYGNSPSMNWTNEEKAIAVQRIAEIINDVEYVKFQNQVTSQIEDMSFTTAQVETFPDVSLRDLQSAIYEIDVQYGQMDREHNLFKGVNLNGKGLHPAENLYPSDNLYPNRGIKDGDNLHPFPSEYQKLWTDTVGEQSFRYLIITYKGLDENNQEKEFTLQRTVNANGTTDYIMSDNWLFKNLIWTESDVGDYADAMVAKMQDIKWFPFEMWAAGLPYVETGDAIEITDKEGDTYVSYILQRQLNGIQNLQDTFINGELDIF